MPEGPVAVEAKVLTRGFHVQVRQTHGPLAAGSASSGGKSSGSEFSSRKPPLYHASSKTWASGDSFASSRTGASHDSLISAAEVVSEAPLSPRSGSLGNATVSPEARRKAAYDPGTAERFCELWAKAFEDAMMAHIRPLLPAKRPKTAAGAASKNKGSGPIELRLALKGGLIKMEHHPMEAWLGVHAPLLRNAVTQVSMWDRVLAAVEIPENRPDSLDLQQGLKWNPKLQARAAVARETARAYVAKADRASSDQERGTKTGALMHVSIEGGDAIFVICGSSEASQRATLAHIAAVDPPSQGVPMRQLHKIHLDVALGPAAVYFAGCTTPLASIQAGTLSGILAVGRQVTAPPQLYSRPIRVGRQRDVDIRVTVKGSRALVKVYTDLQVVAEQVSACYGIGMEATIAMLAQAGKRCSPTDPDTTRPKVPTLPWWDLMRFVWRGKLDLRARDFEFIMAATPQADVTSTTERLQVNASQLRVHLGYGGQIKLMANGASASAYSAAGTDQPAGTLFMLPLVDFPTAQLVISSTWHLPDGRSPDDHHIFPLDPPQEELQGPVDVVALHKTDSISMRMEATFGNAATVATAAGDVSVGDPWATAAAVAVGGGDTSSAALVYLGDHQIMFMKKLIDLLTYPAAYLRMVAKRGTFFTRLDPKRPATGSLPKLLREFDIAVTATPLDVVHYTVDLEDPSCGICITAKEVTFTSSMLTNYPAPRPVTPGMSAIAVKRQLARTTTITLALDVAGSDLRVHWGDVLPPERFRADSKDKLVQLLETQSSAGSQAAAPAASSTLRRMFGGPLQDGFIISVELLTVHQTKSDPRTAREDGVVHLDKPLKVVIQDCRMLIDIDARNAIWGALAHLGTAFAAPLRLPSKQQPAPEAPPVAPQTPSPGSVGFSTPSMKRRSSVDGRRKSKQRMRPSPAPSSELETGGDLLQILLQQKAQAEQAAAASESDSDYESGDEEAAGSPRAEHDIHSRMPGTLGDVAASPHAAPDHQDGTVKEALHADNFAEASQEKAGDGLSPASRAAVVKFEVEVVHLQVNLQAEVSAGRFLLAAEKGQLVGRHLPDLMQNLTTLNLDQVQAHVAQTDIDPDADTAWLRIQQDTLLPSPGGGVSLRRVANPFRLQLSIAKTSSSAAHAAAAGSDASAAGTSTPLRAPPGAGMSASLGPGAGSPEHRTIAGSSGNEIQLTVPEINVTLDSKEFEILTDVISNVGVSPGPEVTGVGRELALMSEAESEEVESARDTFVSLSRYCKTLEAEALIVRAGLGTRVQRTSSGRRRFRLPPRASSSMSRIGQVEKLQVLDLAAALEEVGNVQTALTDHFRALVTSMSPAPATGASARGPQLMLRWGEEQVVGAKLSLDGARSALLDLKAIARKQQEAANASRFTLELPSITWALCHERMPFVELELVGIMLDNFRNKDHSGSSKLIIQRIDVRDAQGQLATTPGTEEGAILSTWNPDASWERDALLRVYAVVGVPTPTHSIYEHVDVMVHPLGVHLTEGVANTCWEYFFPKEDATTKRQEKWVKSVQPTSLSKHTRNKSAGGSWLALSDAADVGSPLSTAQSPPSAGPGDLGPSPAALSSSPAGLRGSPLATHKRHQSWDSSLAFEMARNSSGAEHQASTSDGASQGSGAGPSLLRTLHRKSSSVGTDEDYPQAAATAAATAATAASRRVKRKAGPAPQRKLLFVHVRLNRVHCRVTYKGYPLSFTDFKVLLDNRVYENLEGRWRDLFNRIKWDTIKSVLKSVAGLQGRKFKELLPSYMREDSSDGDKKGSGALSWITGLAKKKKAAAGDEPAENPEAEKARQKQRMLFGQQHFRPKASKSDRAATLDPSAAADAPAGGAPSGSGEEDSDTTQASHHTGLKAGVERAERFLGNLFGGLRSHEGSPASSPRKASTAGAAQPSSATKVDPSGEEGHSDLMDLLGIPKASSGAPQDPFPASDTTLLPARAISGSLPPAPSGSLDRLSSTGSRIELSESDTRRRSGSLPDAALGGLARLSSTGQQESVRPLHSRTESVLVEPADPSPPDLLHSNLGSIPMEPAGPGVPSPQDLLQPRTGPVVGDPAVPAVLSTQKPQQDWRSAAEHVRAVLSGNIAAAESAVSEDMGGGAQ
ncbi:hypothetical protein WJX72_007766 [[Myrmecia] bisecta]|uniref:FMP27/BLTP2/Hobbit GFWDK motif-containing RBG unit domain-containing protein n=1 Tax=[Myrmecia] bisecta TaxID=41462 RepID=A0AAW1PCU1_9CHLO